MEKNFQFITLFSILFIAVYVFGCAMEKKSTVDNQSPVEDSTNHIVFAQADSVVTHSGNGRIEVSWRLKSDANLQSYKVNCFSNELSRSVTNTIQNTGEGNVIHVMFDDLPEGNYIFEIIMYDKKGNPSAKSSATGIVYGADYQSSLTGRTYNHVKIVNNNAIFNWNSSEKDMIGVKVRYKDTLQDTKVHFVPAKKNLDTIKGVVENQYITYRTLYQPDSTAIDTFYTDYISAYFGNKYEYELHYDAPSNTSYYLTRIHHLDAYGQVVKPQLAHTIKKEGETVREFANRTNSTLAFNASTQIKYEDDKQRADMPSGVAVVKGNIINNSPRNKRYTLGIKENNELIVFAPGTTAQEIIDDGVENAVTAFVPLILNHQPVSDKIINYVGNLKVKHPRQVIAQFDNLDILFLTTGGRGFGGDGMTAEDMIRILTKLNVKFAYNLDGGGSTSTVINGKFINWKMDKHGTKERKRPTFLYVK